VKSLGDETCFIPSTISSERYFTRWTHLRL